MGENFNCYNGCAGIASAFRVVNKIVVRVSSVLRRTLNETLDRITEFT